MYADALLAELDQEAPATRRVLERVPGDHLEWRPGPQGFTISRGGLIRTLLFNHWYHHRGQLSVYFRCLGVPVPAVYGRSADEKLFGA